MLHLLVPCVKTEVHIGETIVVVDTGLSAGKKHTLVRLIRPDP